MHRYQLVSKPLRHENHFVLVSCRHASFVAELPEWTTKHLAVNVIYFADAIIYTQWSLLLHKHHREVRSRIVGCIRSPLRFPTLEGGRENRWEVGLRIHLLLARDRRDGSGKIKSLRCHSGYRSLFRSLAVRWCLDTVKIISITLFTPVERNDIRRLLGLLKKIRR